MAQADLEARIRRIEDREAIRTLVGRYSVAVDDHDFETLGGLFARDAVYGRDDDSPREIGREIIKASFTQKLANAGPSFHVNHDTFVNWDEKDPDRATGMVLCHAETSHVGGHNVCAIRYLDEYVREDGAWRFASRRLSFLYFTPVAQYPEVLMHRNRLRMPTGDTPAHWPRYAT